MKDLKLYVEMHNRYLQTKERAYLEAMYYVHGSLSEEAKNILPERDPFYHEITVNDAENLIQYGVSQEGMYQQLLNRARTLAANFDAEVKCSEERIREEYTDRLSEIRLSFDEEKKSAAIMAVENIKNLSWWRRLWKLF